MRIGFWGAQEKQKLQQDAVDWKFSTNVMQIVPQFQVGIISLGALYCEFLVKMKSPVDL